MACTISWPYLIVRQFVVINKLDARRIELKFEQQEVVPDTSRDTMQGRRNVFGIGGGGGATKIRRRSYAKFPQSIRVH